MKVSVYDTYVQREDGVTMHFDILVPNTLINKSIIYNYGYRYLESKPFKTGKLTSKECQFCHIEQATIEVVKAIEQKGFYIIEMENCS